jgi:alanine racemase
MKSFAQINLTHLRENAEALWLSIGRDKFFCPMVKANAYGHGAVEVSKCLEGIGVANLGVVTIEEALELRPHLKSETSILVFSSFDKKELEICSRMNLCPVVAELQTLSNLKEFNLPFPSGVHIKFNTGMNRQGFDLKDLDKVKQFFDSKNTIEIKGICSHFASAEDIEEPDGKSREQIRQFEKVQSVFGDSFIYHFLNSAALLKNHGLEFGARPGLSIYGVSPVAEPRPDIKLKPVMSLKSTILNLRDIGPGDSVSYGGIWTAKSSSRIALIPLGYADGLRRNLSNKIHFSVKGELVPQVGRVCMDYCLADVTKVADRIKVGDTVDILGESLGSGLSVENFAHICETIPYEIFTGIGSRVVRKFYGS